MNVSLKKKLDAAKKKGEQFDQAIEKCIQLEHDKQDLMRIMSSNGPISDAASHLENFNIEKLDDGTTSIDVNGQVSNTVLTPRKASTNISQLGSQSAFTRKDKNPPMTAKNISKKNTQAFLRYE